ncbi:uncharacterized protein LOC115758062 [Drosophila novamexicana]|uniref:uncharacterized protein LOC115758062 n=1 Tax=Drosophila novamexicana TaxID=47314 RepID=UPI0011E5A502|nr:uncharacterized protein LOC115758062 [Drosophila novamexicana]
MDRQLVIVLLLLGCAMHSVWSQTTEIPETTDETETTDTTETTESPNFSCFTYEGTAVDLGGLSGYWYEVARAPDVDDMQCLNYSVPASPNENNMLELQVEYVDTTNGQWESASESGSLAWDDNAKNGIFTWSIGEVTRLPVTYKLVSTDKTTYAFLCGYMGIASVPIFKVWTRHRHLSVDDMLIIQQKFVDIGQVEQLAWVEQSLEKCNNSAMRTAGGALVAFALALILGNI